MKVTEYKYLTENGNMIDRSLHGAFGRGDTVKFELHADGDMVIMEIHRDSEDDLSLVFTKEKEGIFTHFIQMSDLCSDPSGGLYWYRYRIIFADGTTLICGGEAPTTLSPCAEAGDRQLLIYREGYKTPDSLKGGVIYHIFADRFRKGGNYPLKDGAVKADWDSDIPEYGENPGDHVKNNYFYGGDLDGITEKLQYISSLGVEMIYLSPVFDSPSNHRYDTADYMRVDPMLGGDIALERLCREAKALGIGIMLDGVFNHTGSDSVYFNKYGRYPERGAYQSLESPYYELYNFYKYPEEYECWWGVDIMPRVDSGNELWRRFILGKNGVIEKYTAMGVSGWRLDVCDELSDVFLDQLRDTVKKNSENGTVIGEVWEDATNKIAYGKRRRYLRGGQLDSVMNYPFREAVLDYVKYGDHQKFRRITEEIFRRYPEESVHMAMNMLGTHDTVRVITALAGESGDGKSGSELADIRLSVDERKIGVKMVSFAYGIMCALPGMLCLYYGDETGLEGYRDPFCRRPYPWGREDTVMIENFRSIGQVKRNTDALRCGEYKIARITPEILEIHRYLGDRRVIAHFNRGVTPSIVDIPEGYRVILGNRNVSDAVSLGQYESVFLYNG